jgi:hypothetical protein
MYRQAAGFHSYQSFGGVGWSNVPEWKQHRNNLATFMRAL